MFGASTIAPAPGGPRPRRCRSLVGEDRRRLLCEHRRQRFDDFGVEVAAGTPPQLVDCAFVTSFAPVGALLCHRAVGVDGVDDAGFEWNLLAAEGVRKAGAVVAFVRR